MAILGISPREASDYGPIASEVRRGWNLSEGPPLPLLSDFLTNFKNPPDVQSHNVRDHRPNSSLISDKNFTSLATPERRVRDAPIFNNQRLFGSFKKKKKFVSPFVGLNKGDIETGPAVVCAETYKDRDIAASGKGGEIVNAWSASADSSADLHYVPQGNALDTSRGKCNLTNKSSIYFQNLISGSLREQFLNSIKSFLNNLHVARSSSNNYSGADSLDSAFGINSADINFNALHALADSLVKIVFKPVIS